MTTVPRRRRRTVARPKRRSRHDAKVTRRQRRPLNTSTPQLQIPVLKRGEAIELRRRRFHLVLAGWCAFSVTVLLLVSINMIANRGLQNMRFGAATLLFLVPIAWEYAITTFRPRYVLTSEALGYFKGYIATRRWLERERIHEIEYDDGELDVWYDDNRLLTLDLRGIRRDDLKKLQLTGADSIGEVFS